MNRPNTQAGVRGAIKNARKKPLRPGGFALLAPSASRGYLRRCCCSHPGRILVEAEKPNWFETALASSTRMIASPS